MTNKIKVAIIRGSSLNQWEMLNYEPLVSRYHLLMIASQRINSELSEIKAPLKKLFCPGEIAAFIPRGTHFLYRFFGAPTYLWGLQKAISGFDIVHSAEVFHGFSLQAAKLKKKKLVKKLVLTVWETIPFIHREFERQKMLSEEVLANTDFFITPTKKTRDNLIFQGVDRKKITVIPMGVDLSIFKPAPKSNQPKVILSVGRMVPEKGFDVIIKAVALLKNRGVEFKLILVGEGPLRQHLKDLVRKFELEKMVEFLGAVSYRQMPKIYQSADVFVLASQTTPYWEEQFGMVLVEAMAAGLPVVASRTVITKEVIGDAGLFFSERDEVDLAEKIERLLQNFNFSWRLRQKGRVRAEMRYDYKKVSSKIEKIYQSLL